MAVATARWELAAEQVEIGIRAQWEMIEGLAVAVEDFI